MNPRGSTSTSRTVDAETATFDSGSLTSSLPLGGSVHLVMRKSGDFTFSCHAHDSGFDNINYAVSALLMKGTNENCA
jgi:hypothetical protein